jgi:DNA ligase D-like protein (predicted 3'-phosphoesterase)
MPKKTIFVIQKHAATRLHWDFRLQIGKVLKSWAVPKEPSKKVGERRLAVHVADHDLSYAKFEGTIPKGQYGAGTVKIWDKGTYEMIDKKKNKIVFDLHGKKLKGKYCLLKFEKAGPKSWLLFRKKQEK